MKNFLTILALLVLMASSVLATNLVIDPDLVSMATTDVKVVSACISQSGGSPLVGADIVVETYCKDLNSNEVCDGADITFPAGFSAIVIPSSTPTNSSGCGEIKLTTSSASTGAYVYKVNGEDSGIVVASEHGLVLIPEFTTIGATLTLAGAGFYIYRKRKKK